jgi:hypothetical protein
VSATATSTRPPLSRLTLVELRKMTDTKAGFWLQLSVLALAVLVVVVNALAGHATDHQFMDYFSGTSQGISALLPVLGILLVTSEWSQRTAMITFSLVPQRTRVVTAKVLAAVVLALVGLVIALLLSVIGTALTDPGIGQTWRLPPGALGQVALYLTATMLIGVAFGAVLLNSAARPSGRTSAPRWWCGSCCRSRSGWSGSSTARSVRRRSHRGGRYGNRVSDAFGAAGSSITEAGRQLGDWLAKNRNGDDQ